MKKRFAGVSGKAARKAWADQAVRCACGSYGCVDAAVSGSAGLDRARWLGCPSCSGTALGRPLVWRR